MSECTRVYNEQLAHCPCHENCPNGCPCPSYECDVISTTTATTTTTSNTDMKKTAVLILNTRALSQPPMITDLDGRADLANFDYGEGEVYKSCSTVFNGQAYVYGGWRQNQKQRQVSMVKDCHLTSVATLEFDFELGACASTDNTIYLCFDYYTSDTRSCRSSQTPMGPFASISNSTFDHSIIQIAASPG